MHDNGETVLPGEFRYAEGIGTGLAGVRREDNRDGKRLKKGTCMMSCPGPRTTGTASP